MKNTLCVLTILFFALRLTAQTNAPVRLALLSESDEAATAVDVLTAELSSHKDLQLLERNEIDKVYREQGLAVRNVDNLKLGQILGADGLLLMQTVKAGTNQYLNVRLVAVKPGVVLTDGSFPWPLKDNLAWAEAMTTYLNRFLPKLTLLAKDAIPISVVNLRAAVQSTEDLETERQLKLLAIQRLSQERQFFVLERQRMQLLDEEKELKLDDSAFWNGSYLLEGVVDQNGRSPDTITINARLTPPKGGVPLQFEVSGSRTNLSEIINRLAAKTIEALKVNSSVQPWNAADEAQKYFDEAKWALRWGIHSEAQMAADSAWALGKHDQECVTLQINSYLVLPDTGFIGGSSSFPVGGQFSTNDIIQSIIEDNGTNHMWGLNYSVRYFGKSNVGGFTSGGSTDVQYSFVTRFPDSKSIDRALRVLGLYHRFTQNQPPSELETNAVWQHLGIDTLVLASQVLQHFYLVAESQPPVADKLAELRALARSVADGMAKSPSVHDRYFVGNGIATHDSLDPIFTEAPNIYSCEVQWGSFWQERPEDCLALYRSLMSSPAFSYIHTQFWLRDLNTTPRLVAWNENDRRRVPLVWSNFMRELDSSTNLLLRLESKALRLADANSDETISTAFTNLFDCVFENREALVANPVEVVYLDWGIGELVNAKTANGIVSDLRNSLNQLYYSEYSPKLGAMDQEYWNKTLPAAEKQAEQEKQAELQKQYLQRHQPVSAGATLTKFEQRKQYLEEFKPFDSQEFLPLFLGRDYTKTEAFELQPLIAAYKSKLVAQSQAAPADINLMMAVSQVGSVANNLNRIVDPSATLPIQRSPAPTVIPSLITVAPPPSTVPLPKPGPTIVTRVVRAANYLKIPVELYPKEEEIYGDDEQYGKWEFKVYGGRWSDEKLFLDLRHQFVAFGKSFPLLVVFNPANEGWKVIKYPWNPPSDENDFHFNQHPLPEIDTRFVVYQGIYYMVDGGRIKTYAPQTGDWQTLDVVVPSNIGLYAMDGHLYACNDERIFEITDDGKATRILASIRRRPAVTTLDSLESLGSPVLFSGPDHTLGALITGRIYLWDGSDWKASPDLNLPEPPPLATEYVNPTWTAEVQTVPNGATTAETLENAVIQRFESWDYKALLWRRTKGHAVPADTSLVTVNGTYYKTNLYFYVDHANLDEVNATVGSDGEKLPADKNSYYAKLVCISRDFADPIVVPLEFHLEPGQPAPEIPPAAPLYSANAPPPESFSPNIWMQFAGNNLYIGRSDALGFWAVPIADIEAAIAEKKAIQMQQNAQAMAVVLQTKQQADQALNSFVGKYDLNHNGVIEPDEKEQALDDPAFIEHELNAIDINHNGKLEPEELAWFDANRNKILDPKEQDGVEIAEHLLAARILKKYDTNGDGTLDSSEFGAWMESGIEPSSAGQNPMFQVAMAHGMSRQLFNIADKNHDGHVDPAELEILLRQMTLQNLRMKNAPINMPGVGMRIGFNQPYSREFFKAQVESYWKNFDGAIYPAPGQ